MRKAKVKKIVLDNYGSFLGMEKGCFVVKQKNGEIQKYALFGEEIGEVVAKSGNTISVGALASLGFWEIDLMILTRRGKPAAYLRSVNYDSHVKTRICQYQAYLENRVEIATQIVTGKLKGQNQVLRKYGFRPHNLLFEATNIKRLLSYEGKYTQNYFRQIFQLLPEWLRPKKRKTFQAYDGGNNLFNLTYEFLKWRIHRAILKAKLEAYCGFVHSLQFGKPSLVLDMQDLYRYLADDFLIQYSRSLKKKDFIMKFARKHKKTGKRQFLNNQETNQLMNELDNYFERKIEIPRIKHGKRQTIETLISEEALLLAKFLRHERETWKPRIVILN